MSLRKAFILTPARLAANRRNAQKSTGPRTARGKIQTGMNSLREGGRSRLYLNLMQTLLYAPPGAVDRTARAALTPEQAAHPLLAEVVEMFRQAEIQVVLDTRRLNALHQDFADAERGKIQSGPSAARQDRTPGIANGAPGTKKDVKKVRAKPLSV